MIDTEYCDTCSKYCKASVPAHSYISLTLTYSQRYKLELFLGVIKHLKLKIFVILDPQCLTI